MIHFFDERDIMIHSPFYGVPGRFDAVIQPSRGLFFNGKEQRTGKIFSAAAVTLIAAFLLISTAGCGPKAPTGFPSVYPCTVTVTDVGQPVGDVTVTLAPIEGVASGSFTSSGKTDGSGNALISTVWGTYVAKGAPVGKYKVTLIKKFALKHTKTPEEQSRLNSTELSEYIKSLEAERDKQGEAIPTILGNISTTALELTVSESGTTSTFDIAEYKEQKQ